jgi:hypothetical protein
MAHTRLLNERTLGKIFMYLHTKSCHSNPVIQKRWQQAALRFEQHHMPTDRGNTRWINKYTAHRFL